MQISFSQNKKKEITKNLTCKKSTGKKLLNVYILYVFFFSLLHLIYHTNVSFLITSHAAQLLFIIQIDISQTYFEIYYIWLNWKL